MIKSKFVWRTTADEVAEGVDLTGKNVIVTGANTGIGLDTARVLAAKGANVVIACRDANKGENAKQVILKTAKGKVTLMKLDLGSLASVREFATEFKKLNIPLNILINNAGVMIPPYQKTVDGFELQFGTNHLGHFLLTTLLLPELERGAPARVVNVSSAAHAFADVNFADLNWEQGYSKWRAYGQSKSANILFSNELNRRYQSKGITSNSLHPGSIQTELQRHAGWAEYYFCTVAIWLGFFKNPNQGAATSVYCATAPELEGVGGKYFSDSNEAAPWKHVLNESNAARLWDLSENFVGHKAEQ